MTATTPIPAAAPARPAPRVPDRHARERSLFDALRADGEERVRPAALCDTLRGSGLLEDDPRLAGTVRALEALGPGEALDLEAFREVLAPSLLLSERALQGRLVLPDFGGFRARLEDIFERTSGNTSGAVADYIPQLARVDADQYGVSICSVDGQRFSAGDAAVEFSVQSTCKPISYCLALEENGPDVVHAHVGCEPSGLSFNELSLNRRGLPHNPMINAGAIMSSALIGRGLAPADRFDRVMDAWTAMAGGRKPGFGNATYLSERRTADRNFALGYIMRENGGFPDGTDLFDTLEFYFQCCSIEMTAESMAIVAATLANGGVNPLTGRRVLRPDTVQNCLSLMYSCGMYDFSGEWAFTIGLPAKSGVSGAVLVVVPNVLGLCVWSPRIDGNGNSVRGIEFCRELVQTFNFHNYDSLVGLQNGKSDPRLPRDGVRRERVGDLCWAASQGDLVGLRRLVALGADLDAADYDGRTALHLAASEGHRAVVDFFVARGARLDPVDRWGATPLDDALREGHDDVAAVLRAATQGGAA